jgi:hypothetical protein
LPKTTDVDDIVEARSGACARGFDACVFAKAIVAREASCELARRGSVGERDVVGCASPVAHTNCTTLAALLRERSKFVLKLPRAGAPMVHARALQLQCGGVRALRRALASDAADVHRLVGLAHERWGSLLDAPWGEIVAGLADWQPRRRRPPT